MSKHAKHVAKHRAAPARPAAQVPVRALRTTVVLSSVAAAATGLTVAGGVVSSGNGAGGGAADLAGAALPSLSDQTGETSGDASAQQDGVPDGGQDGAETQKSPSDGVTAAELGSREPVLSRGDRRDATDPAKEEALAATDAPAMTASENLADSDPREIGRSLLGEFGFSSDQFGCLDSLWTKESGWNIYADNPSSSAYGIPQSLPGSKMASAGADWADNPVTQIRWGLGYIQDRYGSPCGAWGHSQSYNWY